MTPAPSTRSVAVLMVIHDDAHDLPPCLAAVAALDPAPEELWIADCASSDDGVATARAHWPSGIAGEVLELGENRGFAGGMNAAFAASTCDWVLTLNADARPAPDYLERLLALAESQPTLQPGAVTGRLVRFAVPEEPRRLDACGIYLTPTWRHLDRGSGAVDQGQFSTPQRVFGGTGAATLFRRDALLDVSFPGGEVFDGSFHTFREDAELCFRLQVLGWDVLYAPAARAEHRRFNLPQRRSAIPARFNYHSLKNRYLIRAYHQTFGNFLWTLPATLFRDLAALVWVLLRERTSLAAYHWLWQHRTSILARRRWLRKRRRRPGRALDRWFLRRALPLPDPEAGIDD